MTQVGKERKERVVKKLWFESLSTDLQLSIYLAVLPILKEYVMVFQVGILTFNCFESRVDEHRHDFVWSPRLNCRSSIA